MNYIKTRIIYLITLLIVINATAAPTWKIAPNESNLTFTATQNNAPVTGKFNSFSGEINFDPAELNTSNIKITIDMNSVTTSYSEVAATLKTADWLDVKQFPQAVFTAKDFIKTSDNTYQANGNLTIRDKTLPTTLNFTLKDYSTTQCHVEGSTTIKRTAFGIGQGEWAKTDGVKDNVVINFTISATRK